MSRSLPLHRLSSHFCPAETTNSQWSRKLSSVDDLSISLTNYRRSKDSLDMTEKVHTIDWITINISGTKFVTIRELLTKFPYSRLGRLAQESSADEEGKEYFFARNARIFECILDMYQTGKLHFDSNICSRKMKEELAFWKIDEKMVSSCCRERYDLYEEELQKTRDLHDAFNEGWVSPASKQDSQQTGRSNPIWLFLWNMLESPGAKSAKIWFLIRSTLAVLAFLVFAAGTMLAFRIKNPDSKENVSLSQGSLIQMYEHSRLRKPVWYLDICLSCFFLVEFVVRLLIVATAPKYGFSAFFKSAMNIIDLTCILTDSFVILSVYVLIETNTIHKLSPEARAAMIYMEKALTVFRVLRIARVFRMGSKYSRLRIMILAMRHSTGELMLLVIIMTVGVVLYASMVYVAELQTVDMYLNLWESCWWAIITMTTVGFGDIYPKSVPGKVLGALCALTGVIFISIPIPIIAQNFGKFYNFALRQESREKGFKRLNVSQQLIHSLTTSSILTSNYSVTDFQGSPSRNNKPRPPNENLPELMPSRYRRPTIH